MPLYENAAARIRENLTKLQSGDKVPLIAIGYLTDEQFKKMNTLRDALDLHKLEQNEIIFIGRHLYNSRVKDGYTIDDMIDQITSAMSVTSVINITEAWSRIDNITPRADRYGNLVMDRGVFEMTSKKPRAELYSVMPKGDRNKPL